LLLICFSFCFFTGFWKEENIEMRILNSVMLMAGMAFVLAVAPQASATSVDLVQIGGTATCDGGTGVCTGGISDTMQFAITMQVDADGVNAWSVDLGWDSGLENALTLNASTQPTSYYNGFGNPSPPPTTIGYTAGTTGATQQSSPLQSGHVYAVSGATTQDFNLTIASTSFRAGTATFTIDGTAQTNVALGFLRTDGASMGNSNSEFITPTFGSWIINQAPEPGTTLLMGLGLVGLALAGRRSGN
jgi:hypothetical protein